MFGSLAISITGAVMIAAGLACEAKCLSFSTLVAYAGLVLLHFTGCINLVDSSLIFWGVAALLAFGIAMLLPGKEPTAVRRGSLFLLLGAIAGLLVGMSIDASVMILSAIIGTLIGQLFYSRTPKGRWVKFSFSTFISYFCSVGLKIIVSTAIAGIAMEGFLRNQTVTM